MSDGAKKFLSISIVLVLAVLTFFWYIGKSNSNPNGEEVIGNGEIKLVKRGSTELKSEALRDTDGDGLYDWEEILWETDINLSDTDGDGTNDKEEIALNRDPTKAGPNDRLEELTRDTDVDFKESADLTATDIFAREIFSSYTTLSNPGATDQVKEQIFNETIENVASISSPNIEVTIKTSDSNTVDDYRAYGNYLAQTIEAEAKNIDQNELELLEGLISGDKSVISKLNTSSNSYKKIADDLLAYAVPSNLASLHEDLVIAIYEISDSINDMSLFESDPVQTAIATQVYSEGLDKMYEITVAIREQLTLAGTSFKKEEPGFILNYI